VLPLAKKRKLTKQIIIIDGYNFIKNAAGYRCDWTLIQEGKERLQDALFSFNQRRNHSITVVYDGWKSGNQAECHEKIGGIHIIHSRKGETADKVILRLCEEYPEEPLVITADREIISGVIRIGGQIVSPAEFQKKISTLSSSRPTDYDDEIDDDPAYSRPLNTRKKGPARRSSKAKRKRRTLLDSL
jgi:predicted RNA-binding protein with PIN domain